MTADDGYIRLGDTGVLADGQSRCFDVGDQRVLLVRAGDDFHALSPLCTHANLELAGGRVRNGALMCPFHGARFELATGRNLGPPAFAALERYPLRITDGHIEILLPD